MVKKGMSVTMEKKCEELFKKGYKIFVLTNREDFTEWKIKNQGGLQ